MPGIILIARRFCQKSMKTKENKLLNLYKELYKQYGPQGWWPLFCLRKVGINPTKTGSINGYHPRDYAYPKNSQQRFEICVGAILTQNTTWVNAEKALLALQQKKLLSAGKITSISVKILVNTIRPAGYYNQKARKLKTFSSYFLTLGRRVPRRDELLNIWGIGPETADSILLYAYKQPEFVIDAYTRRILSAQKLIKPKMDYEEIKNMLQNNLPADYKIFQEFHALLVEHAKNSA
ncbi:MAG: endonuclease III domain-containing protein [Patescibacteria group bacterium]|nr:endonuclease III domain-containing protein [Patescibacteria group bacterium]